jgi:UDP-3-O-[3-hydroxymyristoyl] glucosamine N-acyltransferase
LSGQSYSLDELAKKVNGEVIGDSSLQISSIGTIQHSSSGCITFLANPKYKKYLNKTSASAIIVSPEFKDKINSGIVVNDPYLAYAKISSLYQKYPNLYDSKRPSYYIHESSDVDESVIIGPNVFIGPDCKIGQDSIIHANASLVMNVEIGKNSIVHFNSVLGSDGFGYAPHKNGYTKIEQLGKLIIGDNVEIGAGCTIDRGAIENTEIHNGVKLDNLFILRIM